MPTASIAARQQDLLEARPRRLGESADFPTGYRIEWVVPAQRDVAVMEQGAVVGQLHCRTFPTVTHADVQLIGLEIQRSWQQARVGEVSRTPNVEAIALRAAIVRKDVETVCGEVSATDLENPAVASNVPAGEILVQRRETRSRPRRDPVAGQRQSVRCRRREHGARRIELPARKLTVSRVVVVTALPRALERQGPRVQPEILDTPAHALAVLLIPALAIEIQIGTRLVVAGPIAEVRRILADVAEARRVVCFIPAGEWAPRAGPAAGVGRLCLHGFAETGAGQRNAGQPDGSFHHCRRPTVTA